MLTRWYASALVFVLVAIVNGCGGQAPDGRSRTATAIANGDPSTQLRALLGALDSKTYNIAYHVSGGGGDVSSGGTLKQVRQGGKFLEDFDVAYGSSTATHLREISFINGTSTILCVNDFGAALIGDSLPLPANHCVDIARIGGNPDAPESLIAQLLLTDSQPVTVKVTATSQRTIAGRLARCYQATLVPPAGTSADDGPENANACFSGDGLLLSLSTQPIADAGGNKLVLLATTVTNAVGNADFKLPYPLFEPKTFALDVENDSDQAIDASGQRDATGLTFGNVEVAAHDSGVLNTPSLASSPDTLDVRSDAGWEFTCAWNDAKAHEPIVVSVSAKSGANGTVQPVPHANCMMYETRALPSDIRQP